MKMPTNKTLKTLARVKAPLGVIVAMRGYAGIAVENAAIVLNVVMGISSLRVAML